MNNHSYKNRSNLLKGIGILCLFIIFGYYSYQDAINKKMLERSLNEDAMDRKMWERRWNEKAARLQRRFNNKSARPQPASATYEDAAHKNTSGKTQYAATEDSNDCDTFNENLDNFLDDPEDELTYPPEIYGTQMDETEDEYDRPDFEY